MLRIVALFALIVGTGTAQQTQPVLEQNRCDIALTTAGTNTIQLDNRTLKCINWTMSYYSVGFSAISIEVDGAPDATPIGSSVGTPGSWVTFQSITGVTIGTGQSNPNTNTGQQSVTFLGYAPWVRINLTAATGTGRLIGELYGDRNGQGNGAGGGGGGGGSGPCSESGPCPVDGPTGVGTAPSTPPVYTAGLDSTGLVFNSQFCTATAVIAATAGGETQLVAAVSGKKIYVCRISLTTSTSVSLQFDYGTGSACGTGLTHITGLYSNVATLTEPESNSYWITPASQALCINQSTTSTTGGTVSYAQY